MKKTINVTLLCHRFPPAMGGGETIIYSLAKYLARKPHLRVTVITDKNKLGLSLSDKMQNGFKVINIPGFEQFATGELGIKFFLPEVFKAINESSPDVIHAFNFYPGYVGSIFAMYNKVPFVFTYFNTPQGNNNKIQLFLGLNEQVDQALISHLLSSLNFDYLVTLSKFYKESTLKMGVPEDKIRWCYPGPDPEFFNPGLRSAKIRGKFDISPSDYLIVVPARIVPRKRIEIVVHSLLYLEDLPVKLLISSGGTVQSGYEKYYQDILNLMHKNKLENKVIFPKQQFDLSELGSLYASSDICVLPSAFEGLGVGILEAMQCGIPVVASNTEGITEIIDDNKNGLLFNREDSKDLAKNIATLIKDKKLRSSIVKSAHGILQSKFDLQNFISLHEDLYEEITRS